MKNIEHPPIIRTDRLVLRQWSSADLEPFASMNADPRVREYFPGLQTKEESNHSVSIVSNHIEKFGWGFWASSLAETGEFIGFIGFRDFLLSNPDALQEYAELKKKAAIEAGQNGEKYRKMKEPMFQKFNASQSTRNGRMKKK